MEYEVFNNIIWSSFHPAIQTLRFKSRRFLCDSYNKRVQDIRFTKELQPLVMEAVVYDGRTPYDFFTDCFNYGIKAVPNASQAKLPPSISYGFGSPAGGVYVPGALVLTDAIYSYILSGGGFPIFDPDTVTAAELLRAYPARVLPETHLFSGYQGPSVVMLGLDGNPVGYGDLRVPGRYRVLRRPPIPVTEETQQPGGPDLQTVNLAPTAPRTGNTRFEPADDDEHFPLPNVVVTQGNFRGYKSGELRADGMWSCWWQSS